MIIAVTLFIFLLLWFIWADYPKRRIAGLARRIAARKARKSNDGDQQIPKHLVERVSCIVESQDAGLREEKTGEPPGGRAKHEFGQVDSSLQ